MVTRLEKVGDKSNLVIHTTWYPAVEKLWQSAIFKVKVVGHLYFNTGDYCGVQTATQRHVVCFR